MTSTAVIDYEKNVFGLSIYDDEQKHFIIVKDTYDSYECEILKSTLMRLNVDVLLLNLKLEDKIYTNIAEANIQSSLIDSRTLRKVNKSFFKEKEFSLSSKCYNALFMYLQKEKLEFIGVKSSNITRSKVESKSEDFMTLLGYIEEFTIYLFEHSKYLYMTYDSLKSLGIFQEKSNPNLLIKSKLKNTSLFGIINHTCTSYGAEMLKKWLYFPLFDAIQIEKRRDIIEFILKNELNKKLTQCLKKCRGIENMDKNFTDKKFHTYFSLLEAFVNSAKEIFSLLCLELPVSSLNEMFRLCKDNIDLKGDKMFIIKKGVCDEIDVQKKLYEELPEYLNEVAKKVIHEYKIELVIVYFPQLGYLIETNQIIEGLEPIINTSDIYYYKNEFMNVLDDELGDVLNKILDLEKDLIFALKAKIDKYKQYIQVYIDHLSRIDCLNSLAITAKKYNLKKSKISEKLGYIEFRGFRNIFMDIPFSNNIDTSIKIKGNIILTGDNGTGKSTFLKSIGLLIIMNQIGSFIPCKFLEISLFDKIFTKFNSIESLRNKRSAFFSDVLQINQAFYYGTSSSILLVDEFGKGTNIIDGVSLLFSIINNLDRFLCIYITHFQEFFGDNLLRNVAHYHFSQFKLKEGMFNEDYTSNIFQRLQYDQDFISNYEKLKLQIRNHEVVNEKRDESWAVKIINDFIMENK